MKAACIRGHAYTPENTKWDGRGRYRCRTCHLQNKKVYRRRSALARCFNGGTRTSPKTKSPIVRQLFEIAVFEEVSVLSLSIKSGYHDRLVSNWRSGRYQPNINAVVDLYNALGYDLVPVKRGEQ